MPRILYVVTSAGGIAGGHKIIFRHVEALRTLGFDASCYINPNFQVPAWFEHNAPVERGTSLRHDDLVVLPDDEHLAIRSLLTKSQRVVILSQNPYYFAASPAFDLVTQFPASRFPTFIAVAPKLAAFIQRAFPEAAVEIVPCFADDRLFRAGAAKRGAVACVPRKRPVEAAAIRALFRRLYPAHLDFAWTELKSVTEAQVAEAFGASELFLSLSHLESVGMTPLEAMASGALCAGFTGVGGLEYATAENGFWVDSEDCVAAADALAAAADLVRSGGAPLRQRLEAGHETARQWSYARFVQSLEEVWMRLAPGARVSSGPLTTPS
jgi:hypothetical protein